MASYKVIIPSVVALMGSAFAFGYPSAPGPQVGLYLGGTETHINPQPLQLSSEADSLVSSAQLSTDFTWGFNAAYRLIPSRTALVTRLVRDATIGLDFFYLQTQQNGSVWQYEQSAYDNYHYKLNVHSARLLVDSEWTFCPKHTEWFPFVMGGVGFVYNTLSYSDQANISGSGGNLSIGQNGQYRFAYTGGAGLKYDMPAIKNTELSVRYLFTGLGNASTSSNPTLPLAAPLTVNLYTQAWVFGFTYLFS